MPSANYTPDDVPLTRPDSETRLGYLATGPPDVCPSKSVPAGAPVRWMSGEHVKQRTVPRMCTAWAGEVEPRGSGLAHPP
jgi:hypothetical protein